MKRRLAVGFCLLMLVASAACDTVHVVQPGETLYSIAKRYGVKLEDLERDNGIDAAAVTKVLPGTRLTIRESREAARTYVTHVVEEGETLWSVSQRYGTTVAEIEAVNPGVKAGKLYVGAKLKVPVTGAAASRPEPAAPPAGANPTPTPAAAPTEAELWPHTGPRTAVTDKHFKHTKISGKVGDSVTAVSPGRVACVQPFVGYGIVVIIETRATQSRDAYQFWYAGLGDVYVRGGDWVEKGATIARMGADASNGKGQVLFAVYYRGIQPVDHTRLSWQ